MIKIMILEDIKVIPQGFTLWGSIPDAEEHTSQQITQFLNQHLNSIRYLSFLNSHGSYSHLPVKSFQTPSSISGSLVLVFLIEADRLPGDLTPGTILFKDEQMNAAPSNAKLSTSSI